MPTALHPKATAKVAVIALTCTSIEWYDFFLYGTAAALVFPTVFFPADLPHIAGLIAAFGTFAVGFIARPIGGVLFGHFGDNHGRKRALVAALLLMGSATTLIGCLPTYSSIGPAAVVLLTALRFVQGLAVGGQWGGAVVIVTENAPPSRRGFYGSFAQAGAPIGVILANLIFLAVSANLSEAQFMTWGWRVPFLTSIALIMLGMYCQLRLEETPAFRELIVARARRKEEQSNQLAVDRKLTVEQARTYVAEEPRRSPILQALTTYPREIALAAGASIAVQVAFYILIAFVVAYGTNPHGPNLSRNFMLFGVLAGAVIMTPAVFVAGALSDNFGRRGIYICGATLLAMWGFAIFPLIDRGELLWTVVAIGIGQVFVAMMYGPQAALIAEMFSARVRYSGASLGYQFGAILGGGFAPLIATALLRQFGDAVAISVFIAIACAITITSTIFLKETYNTKLENVE